MSEWVGWWVGGGVSESVCQSVSQSQCSLDIIVKYILHFYGLLSLE